MQIGLITTRTRPQKAPGIMVDDDGEIAMALAVGDLVDAYAGDLREYIELQVRGRRDALENRAYAPPRDAK